MGLVALLVVATLPPVASAEAALPPLGMSVGSIAGLTAAGAPPRYGSYWVGDWMADHGWGGFDSAMRTARSAGVTPVIYWYYWGDSISPSCFDADGCNGRTEREWNTLTDELVARLRSTLEGREALVVLENEFNKGGITGDYAPTFDAKLAAVAAKLKGVEGVKLVVGFGAWGETSWSKFPKTIAASEYVGFQMMRAQTRDTEAEYRAAATRSAYLTNYIADKFDKPSFLYDLALSSYPDDRWKTIQAETLDAIFDSLVSSGNTGLQGVVYRSLNDHYMSPSNYYGYAESHWGLRTKDGVPKPAFDVWVSHAKGASTPPPPPSPNVPGSFEAEAMSATKGGRASDPAASGGALWNLWANGDLTQTLVAAEPYEGQLRVVARGHLAAGVAPRMELRLDDALLGAFDVPAAAATYAVDVSLPQGSSTLRIRFTNDAVVNGEDRNLLVDVAHVAPRATNAAPVASFAASVDGLAASFDASASSDADGDALTYAWSFGDGATASGRTASHTYAGDGTYRVTLVVSDGKTQDAAARDVQVAAPNTAPVASFTASGAGLGASFDASASSDADGDALTYAWSFGDGRTGSGRTASHTYAAAGTYRVTLTVSDGEASASATRDVVATQPNRAPTAAIDITGSGAERTFSPARSSDPDGDAMTFTWKFSDGQWRNATTVTRTFAPGSYAVRLFATDAHGLTGEVAVPFTIAAPEPFRAKFTPHDGNDWWVQTKVDANHDVRSVCASVNGGACQPLELRSWGSWAASFFVRDGSSVVFRATSAGGETVTSGAYSWPTGQPVGATPAVKFTPYDGTTKWVQTKVETTATVKAVCASLNGGSCKALTYRSWGAWAAGLSAPTGTKVVFTATLADGTKVKSATYTWPVK